MHISTDAVFDGDRRLYREDDPPNPLSIYARTKLEGEQAVLQPNPQALVARVNLFGWSLSGKRSLAEFFFNNLKRGKSVRVLPTFSSARCWSNDLARILLRNAGAET